MNYTPEYIRQRLKEAGQTVMMFKGRVGPKPPGSCWPDTVRERLFDLLFDDQGRPVGYVEIYQDVQPRKPHPTPRQYTEYDEVIKWLAELRGECVQRRIPWVFYVMRHGMLHWPDTGKQRYSWRKIGKIMGCSHEAARIWYSDGISMIADRQNSRLTKPSKIA